MAHELLSYEYYGGNVPPITAASDTWAFGMTVLEVRSPLPHVANWSNEYTCTGPDTHGGNAILLDDTATPPLFSLSYMGADHRTSTIR
jgi:hypothetical protein